MRRRFRTYFILLKKEPKRNNTNTKLLKCLPFLAQFGCVVLPFFGVKSKNTSHLRKCDKQKKITSKLLVGNVRFSSQHQRSGVFLRTNRVYRFTAKHPPTKRKNSNPLPCEHEHRSAFFCTKASPFQIISTENEHKQCGRQYLVFLNVKPNINL